MRDAECTRFLQWALPQMGKRWPGFRKVRRQVCKRIARRLNELGLETVDDYRRQLEADRDEWAVLDAACRITISRFYRDKHVFDVLGNVVLPELAQNAAVEGRAVRIWSAGCASGEEVYTLAILWARTVPPATASVGVEIIGTDADPVMATRAGRGCYSAASLKDMPEGWLGEAFRPSGGEYCVADRYRQHISIRKQDIREQMPEGLFDLVMCRNLAFTYFAPAVQNRVLAGIRRHLRPSGVLVLGAHEALPENNNVFQPLAGCREIHRYLPGINTDDPGQGVCSV